MFKKLIFIKSGKMTITYTELTEKLRAGISLEELKTLAIDATSFNGDLKDGRNHPLHIAAFELNDTKIFEYLVSQGANLNFGYKKWVLFFNELFYKDRIEMIKLVIQKLSKEEIETLDKASGHGYGRQTFLSHSIYKNNKELVDMILAKGVDPDSKYYDEEHDKIAGFLLQSPIFTAAQKGLDDIVKTLVKAGANPKYTTDIHHSEYNKDFVYFEKSDIVDIYADRKNMEMVKFLVDAGVPSTGASIRLAAELKDPEMVEYLASKGGKVEFDTLLELAKQNRRYRDSI
jgi:hypothetical protein